MLKAIKDLILFIIKELERERCKAEIRGLYINNDIPKTLGSSIRRYRND